MNIVAFVRMRQLVVVVYGTISTQQLPIRTTATKKVYRQLKVPKFEAYTVSWIILSISWTIKVLNWTILELYLEVFCSILNYISNTLNYISTILNYKSTILNYIRQP